MRFDSSHRARAALLFSTVLLSACSYLPEMPSIAGITPYRIDIQQGNFLSREMVAQLKLGMTREQVRFVLGSPMVTDIFHADRWDYVFFRQPARGKIENRRLAVFFEKDRLARVEGDLSLTEGEAPAAGQASPRAAPAEAREVESEKVDASKAAAKN